MNEKEREIMKQSVCTICGSVLIGELRNNSEEYDECQKYQWKCQNKKCHRNKNLLYGYSYKKGDGGIDACVKPKVYYRTVGNILELTKNGKIFKKVNVSHL